MVLVAGIAGSERQQSEIVRPGEECSEYFDSVDGDLRHDPDRPICELLAACMNGQQAWQRRSQLWLSSGTCLRSRL